MDMIESCAKCNYACPIRDLFDLNKELRHERVIPSSVYIYCKIYILPEDIITNVYKFSPLKFN